MKYLLCALTTLAAVAWCAAPARASVIVNAPRSIGLTNGLVGWWTFDGKQSAATQTYDASGNGNTGRLTGSNGLPVRAVGKIGQGMRFDGVDDRVNAGNAALLDLNTNFTLSAWVNVTAFSNTSGIVARGASQTVIIRADAGAGCAVPPNCFVFRLNDGTNNVENSFDGVVANRWYHIVLVVGTRGPGGLRGYIDGVERVNEDTSAVGTITSSDNWYIGYNERNGVYFNGLIDDVRIYNRVLTADEIKRLYNIGGTVKLNTSQNLNNNNSLQNGLVGWWTFDGKDMAGDISSRRYVFDRSGQGNRGAYWNATGTPPAVGKIGQGLSFDGVDDYVDIGDVNTFDFGTGPFTVSMWVRANSARDDVVLLKDLYAGGGNGLYFYINTSSGGYTYINGPGHIVFGTSDIGVWHHHVAVRQGTGTNQVILYRDGVQAAVGTDSRTLSNTNSLRFGWDGAEADAGFNGTLDDVRIYNRALSADEIKRLYNLGGTVKLNTSQNLNNNNSLQKGLVGWWTFDGKDISGGKSSGKLIAFDRSGSGNDGTAKTTNIPTQASGRIGQGLSFDGVDDYVTNTSFSWPTTNTEITVSFWNYATVGVNGNAFSIGLQGPPDLIDVYAPFTDNNFYWDYGDTAANGRISTSYASYLNKWTHVTVVSKGNSGNFKGIYLNGVLVASGNVSDGPNNNLTGIEIGSWGASYHKGTLDDFRIYNRVLSPDEIKRLYNMGR